VNIKINIVSVPFFGFPKEYEISFLNFLSTVFCMIFRVVDFFHRDVVINAIGVSTIIHAREATLEEGSKIENRFVIIFILFFFFSCSLFWSHFLWGKLILSLLVKESPLILLLERVI
jgi:hypothetical protein